MPMQHKEVQTWLKEKGFDPGPVDGVWGPQTDAAFYNFMESRQSRIGFVWKNAAFIRKVTAFAQLICLEAGHDPGPIDGWIGPQTRVAMDALAGRPFNRPDTSTAPTPPQTPVTTRWPTQSQVPSFFGAVGQNQTLLTLPYPMKLAWNDQTVTRTSCHVKVAESLERVLESVRRVYGLSEIRRLRLDIFGGCLNVRKMRGGSAWSMHSWGIALDFDPDNNQLSWGRDRARFAKPEYKAWWEVWEAEGWVSLGRARNFDWMHVQAARL